MKLFYLLVLVTLFCIPAAAQQKLKIGDRAPQFSHLSLENEQFDLSQLKGKVVLLTFWSTSCPICEVEIPKLNKISHKYEGREVVLLGLGLQPAAKISPFLKKHPFEFPVIPNSFGSVLAYADRDRSGNLDMGFPAYYLVDQNGVIKMRESGFGKVPALESAMSSLLSN